MTEILHGKFEAEKDTEFVVDLRGGNIAGNIVACHIDAPPGEVVVTGMQSGNIMVLLPPEGVPAFIFNQLPLKMPFVIAARVFLRLRALNPVRGQVFVVLNTRDEPPSPPHYALGLVPQPPPFGM